MTESALKSRMGRRIALTLAVGILVPVLALSVSYARLLGETHAAATERRLMGVSQTYARSLRSRLGVVDNHQSRHLVRLGRTTPFRRTRRAPAPSTPRC